MQRILFLTMLLIATDALGAGFAIKDQGTKAMSMAHAFAAVADDASAAWYNPAGIAFQEKSALLVGGEWVNVDSQHVSATTGQRYTMDKKNHIIPYIYMGYQLDESPLSISFAVNSPFGLATDWTQSAAPFTQATAAKSLTYTQLKLINLNPTLAYQVSPNLSLALGVMYFDAQKVAFDSPVVVQRGKGSGVGANAALLYQGEGFNVGLSYRSRVKIDVTGTATGGPALAGFNLQGVSAPVSVGLTTPDMASLGVAFHASEKLLISMQADWINWKTFDQLKFNYGASALNGALGTTQIEPEAWKAVTAYALAGEWSIQPHQHLRAGYAFDPSPRNPAHFSPRAADNDRHLFTLGYGQSFEGLGTWNVAYGYTQLKSLNQQVSPAATQRNGTYKASAQMLATDFQIQF